VRFIHSLTRAEGSTASLGVPGEASGRAAADPVALEAFLDSVWISEEPGGAVDDDPAGWRRRGDEPLRSRVADDYCLLVTLPPPAEFDSLALHLVGQLRVLIGRARELMAITGGG